MAKDKSKKSTKPATDEFAKPSEATGGGDNWSLTDGDEKKSGKNDGELFLITPLRKETVTTEKYGEKEVIVADVVHLNEKKPAKSVEHEGVFVFGAWLQGSLNSYIGEQKVLGRLDKAADSTSGRGYVWKLEDADDDDIEVARAYVASIDPFAKKTKGAVETKPAKKGKKSEPEPEPEKKSKKAKPSPEPEKKSKKAKGTPEPEPKSKKKSKK